MLALVEVLEPLLHDALRCARRQGACARNDRGFDALG
jgi:hypothetical protein